MRDKRAFTLIELLVVIAIIALLLSILMPAFSTAKAIAAGVVCTSNEKQLTLAWIMYAGDNNDYICDAVPVGTSTGIASGQWGFVAAPMNIGGGRSTSTLEDRIRGFEKGALWAYLETHKVFHCPVDKRWKKASSGAYRSYSIGAVLSPLYYPNAGWGQGKVAIIKMTQFTSPSDKFIFLEETEAGAFNHNTWDIDLNNPSWIDPFAILHNDSSTFGYADGHAGRHKWTQERTRWLAETGGKFKPVIDNNMHPGSTLEDYNWFVKHYTPRPER
jgi:prepilin-type N-terminal cleavage/methylation domain-containing protein/prepilin-type processing-associated H-X9-DG protein